MTFFIALLLAKTVFAQTDSPPAIEWVTEYGTMFYDAHETSNRQFIVAGRKHYSDYARTFFLYNGDGSLIWESGIPGFRDFTCSYWIEELLDGSFVGAGTGRDSVSETRGLLLAGLSNTGNLLWWKCYDFPDSNETPYCVLPMSDGRFALCGEIAPVLPGNTSSFIMVTDAQGDSLWTVKLGRDYANRAHRILEYEDQLIVYIHSTAGVRILSLNSDSGDILWEADGYPDVLNYGDIGGDMTLSTVEEGFTFVSASVPHIAHTDEYGNLQWYYELPYWSFPRGHSVNSTMDGGYIYGGENTPGWPPDGIQTGMVVKLDSEGTVQWVDFVYEAHDIQSISQISTGGYIACGGETPATLIRYEPETGIEAIPPPGVEITSLSPVPFSESLTVNYSLDETALVEFQVFDLTGRLVHSSTEGSLTAGSHNWIWNATGQSSGCYLVRLCTESENRSRYCILVE